MPNWCINNLIVMGPEKSLDAFKKKAHREEGADFQTDLSLDNFLPTCEGKSFETGDWYEWRLENWGTKWDIRATLDGDDGQLIYLFDSAWSPPLSALQQISSMYPDLEFEIEYEEGGMGFYGRYRFSNGDIKYSEEGDTITYSCPNCKEGCIMFGLNEVETCWNCGKAYAKSECEETGHPIE